MLLKDLREKTVPELIDIKIELEKRLYVIRLQTKIGQNIYVHKIPALKKDIARIYTILNEKNYSKKQINFYETKIKPVDLNKQIEEERKINEKLQSQKEAKAIKEEKEVIKTQKQDKKSSNQDKQVVLKDKIKAESTKKQK